MAICVECGGLYPGRRKRLGYNTCLDCGDEKATREIERKFECTAPLYNKGPYGYIATKKEAKDVGK